MLQGTSELVSIPVTVYRINQAKAQAYGQRQKVRQDFVADRDSSHHWWVATRTLESEVTCSKSTLFDRIFKRTVRHLAYYSYSYINN